jgi:hypothetical protein
MSAFDEHLEAGLVDEKLKRSYTENDRLTRALRKEKEKTGRLVAAAESAIHEAVSSLVIPKVAKPPARKQALGSEEVAVVWISDIQLGKSTPNFNSDIAEERMERYAKKVIKLTNMHRSAVPIKKAHVWMLGDIVEGEDIFPGQQWLIDSSLYEQAMNRGPRILANFVRTMLGNFDEVKVSAVIGNHGRIGRKGAYHPETNTDRMCYKVTQTILNDEIESGRLEWNQNDPGNSGDRGWYETDTIGDYTALLVHGDQFKGSMGIPWYGVRKKVLGWHAMAENNLPFPHFDDIAFGHWHQSVTWTINDIGVMGNGSVESWNDYAAENLAGMGRPSQRMMFVSPSRGQVTSHYPEIWLD